MFVFVSFLFLVPDRIWTINDLTEEELRNLQVDIRNSDNQTKWWEYEPLKSLDLSSNSLTKLSENVKGLADLVNLDVSVQLFLKVDIFYINSKL